MNKPMSRIVVRAALALASVASTFAATKALADTPKPDLIVREDVLQNHWIVRLETFTADECAAIEGGITAGEHPVLRFSVSTPNIGNADLALGDPNAHVAANDGLYEFAQCHHHFHFRHYAKYELIDPATGKTWRAAKRGFCMIDVAPNPAWMGQAPGRHQFTVCGRVGIPGNQGISAGWADEYVWLLQGQLFVLDGGDGQDPVPPGRYIIRITVNPGFIPQPGELCRNADPNHPGVCHQLPESNFDNNVGEAVVVVPDHSGRTAVGPGANDPAPDAAHLTDATGDPLP